MTKWIGIAIVSTSFIIACGGKNGGSTTAGGSGGSTAGEDDGMDMMMGKATAMDATGDPNAEYAPLDIGADWQSYAKMNSAPVFCTDHGKRCCDTYVNDVGAAAYKDSSAAIPIGTIVVKVSWENPTRDAKGCENPSSVAGPIFVMKKTEEVTEDSEGDGWWYAIHWEKVPERWQKRLGAKSIYWRTPSKRAQYCIDCHTEVYGDERSLGGIPEDKRAW